MIPLDSERWAELGHAYGTAENIPELLRRLGSAPEPTPYGDEPWFSIWSALAHQGDVYSASFAAVPHVVAVMAKDPKNAEWQYLAFPAWVEICRRKKSVPIPPDIEQDYFGALKQIPTLVAATLDRDWSPDFLTSALAAIAIAKGESSIAEVILNLSPDVAEKFAEWQQNQ